MFTPPLDALLIFLVVTPAVGWLAEKRGHRKILGIYALASLGIVAYYLHGLYWEVTTIGGVSIPGQPTVHTSLGACLEIDLSSIFMAFLQVAAGFFAVAYSVKLMEHESGLTEYYTLILGMVAGMIGTVFAGDFFTLFVFWELMCLTSYALVAFRKERPEPVEAGFKYLVMSTAGSTTILLSMSFLYGMTGTLNFEVLADRLANPASEWLNIALALVMVGFGIKAAMVPFHTWLPDAQQEAPAPISALLAGAVDPTAAYILIRVLLSVFGSTQSTWQMTLTVFAVLTMFGGNLMALTQNDIKRLLAYSTIAHMGYILFGFAVTSQQGLTASLFHIMNHAIMKTLLFLCAGAFIYRTGTRDLRKLKGIKRTMPVTSLFLSIGTLAIAAIPPLNGFWSELLIVSSGVEAGMLLPSVLMVVNMVLSVAYYLRLIDVIVLKEPTSVSEKATEAPGSMLIPLSILAVLCIIIGMFPGSFITLAQKAAEAALSV